ncbi:uncharacterized protein CTRU02_205594 [Colletotrichum truncatum]|uniref:Uncharacterized protein n=1 Tax=Colletotrichum truncatum TaxID=5467 RepID=A0ACC3Z4E0_COLTU|nr:uncharacterized protein CTRU02_09348 [Colletotrichum truncatum]KAF6788539.1 hypothetical protein CTRU02_09348 [Colletotrichum truncatum]
MESAQYTEGSSPSSSSNSNTRPQPRNNSTHQQQANAHLPRRRRPSARPPSSDFVETRSTSEGSDRERGSDVEELGRFSRSLPKINSGSRQSRLGASRRQQSSNPRPAPALTMPSEDEQLVEPVPRRPAMPVRRSAPRRIPHLGESNISHSSDTDTTSSSSSSGPPPIRRRPIRTRTEMDLSLRGPILEKSEEGSVVPPGTEFGPGYDGDRPLPVRTRNPRDILNDGERGFIVDLKMNLEVEIELKAAIMGDLTLSVL